MDAIQFTLWVLWFEISLFVVSSYIVAQSGQSFQFGEKNMSISSGLGAGRLSNEDDENKLLILLGWHWCETGVSSWTGTDHNLWVILVKSKMSDQY